MAGVLDAGVPEEEEPEIKHVRVEDDIEVAVESCRLVSSSQPETGAEEKAMVEVVVVSSVQGAEEMAMVEVVVEEVPASKIPSTDEAVVEKAAVEETAH